MRLTPEDAKAYARSTSNRRGLFSDEGPNFSIPCRRYEDGDDLVFLGYVVPTGCDITFSFDDLGWTFLAVTGDSGEMKIVFDKKSLRLKEIVLPDGWNFSKPMRN